MDDQQRARELLADACRADGLDRVALDIQHGMHASHFADIALKAITAALRTALEVGDSHVVLQRVDLKRLLAGDENSPGYELSRRRISDCLAARRHVSLPQSDLERINEVAARPQGVKDAP